MSEPEKTLRVAHISDLHIARPPVRADLNLKRLLGRVNYLLFRSRRYLEHIAIAAIEEMVSRKPDLVLLTGDLTQLGLDFEFDAAERVLEPIRSAGIPVIAVAGNHDIYGADSGRRFERFRQQVALGLTEDDDGIIRLHGLEILPLEQGIISLPFFSHGRQGVEELRQASPAWTKPQSGVVRLACGHYPVIDPHGGRLLFLHGLRELELLVDFCQHHHVAAYFCGHNHRRFSAAMPGGCIQFSAPALSDIRYAKTERASIYLCDPAADVRVRED